jgi:hypothetical protein
MVADKLFLAFQPLDQWHWNAFQPGPKKWHQNFYSQDLQKVKLKII